MASTSIDSYPFNPQDGIYFSDFAIWCATKLKSFANFETASKAFNTCLYYAKRLPEYVSEKSVNVFSGVNSGCLYLIDLAKTHPIIYGAVTIAVTYKVLPIAIKQIYRLCALKSRNSALQNQVKQQKIEAAKDLEEAQEENDDLKEKNDDLSAENKDLRKENKDFKNQIKLEKDKAQKEIDDLKEQLEYYVAQTRLYQAIANDINVPVPENGIKRLN